MEIPVAETVSGALTKDELSEAKQRENSLVEQDLKMESTKDKKNALESYVYEMRDKVTTQSFNLEYSVKVIPCLAPSSSILSFARVYIFYTWQMLNTYQNTATESERESIARNLQETENWLYEDGDDESENAYIEKLNDIKKVTLLSRSFVYIKASVCR